MSSRSKFEPTRRYSTASPRLRSVSTSVIAQKALATKHPLGCFVFAGQRSSESCIALATQGRYNKLVHFVYILRSEKDRSLYIGYTEDVKRRFKDHNEGSARYSSTKLPYKLIWFCAFPSKPKALEFESYLKHGSGHAFMNKHLV